MQEEPEVRTASATQSSLVSAHASMRRSAACGTPRCPLVSRPAGSGFCAIAGDSATRRGSGHVPWRFPARKSAGERAAGGGGITL